MSEQGGAGQVVMPFYLLCDVSRAMTGNIAALGDGVARLRRAVVAEPVVDDVGRFCVISFSDAAKVKVPLDRMSDAQAPKFAVEGGSNYGAAFRMLAEVVKSDIARLRGHGLIVRRPCAFFLVGSAPQDADRRQSFRMALAGDLETDLAHPIFVPLGFWGAPQDVLKALAYPPVMGRRYPAARTSLEDAVDAVIREVMLAAVLTQYGDIDDRAAPPPEPTLADTAVSRASLGTLSWLAAGAQLRHRAQRQDRPFRPGDLGLKLQVQQSQRRRLGRHPCLGGEQRRQFGHRTQRQHRPPRPGDLGSATSSTVPVPSPRTAPMSGC